MDVFAGVYVVSAVLLGIAAVGKLRKPATMKAALRALRLPHHAMAVRLIAVVELFIAAGALLLPSHWVEAALAGTYGIFAVVVGVLLVSGKREISCGCFGVEAAEPVKAGETLRVRIY